ncbi:hypothetical protein Gogos_022421 [Gossypium gossypioides]|uniref:DUF7745 domain-containing protein n=2 Tax=Gossypium gossypioides TaxID=34282 RepID=A0A7J9CZ60_GOSGO|nr:hypothetical protein [Gossypium gossypioides]
MENEFLDKVEDNAIVRLWLEKVQLEKGDSLAKGYVSELWDYTHISVTQNSLQELKKIWDRWNDETKQLFYSNYGDLPYVFDIKVDEQLFRALAQYWNPAYSSFTFGKVDLVPTVEEYTALLHCPRFQVDKAYSRAAYVPVFWKKLMNITGMSEQWITARIKQKGECKCIPWKNLRDLILAHLDARLDSSASRCEKEGDTPVPTILAETFRSLNACRRAEEDIEWRAPWLIPDGILYRCESFDLVPLLRIWGVVGYAPLLALRQYGSRQFVPATHGMKRLAVGSMMTPEYGEWRSKRINDNIPEINLEGVRPMEEYLQLEAKKLRKGKNKAEEDLDSLKLDYKKLRLSMRTVGLGKTSEQWRQEIQEERNKADWWEKKSQETQVQKETLERQMLEIQNHQAELKARIAELERSLALYRSHNSMLELKASLCKIEEMKKRIEELEYALQSCEH